MPKKKYLITGGLGFIGSHLAARLLDEGGEVTIIDSMIPEYGGNPFNIEKIKDRLKVNIADIRDSHGLRHLVRDQDVIFNLAGQTSHLDSMKEPYTDLEINCAAQLSLLEIIREHNPEAKVIFASTRQIYGKPQYLPVDEKHPLVAADINGIHKIAGESYHTLYSHVYGMRTCSLRLTNTIGPHMRVKDERQTFVGIWIRNLLEGKAIEVWGGEQVRDFNFVGDVVEAFMMAANCEAVNGKALNIGAEESISLIDLANLLLEMNDGKGEINLTEFPEDRGKIDIGDYRADFSAFTKLTGWKPETKLKKALKLTLDFYREHLKHYI